MLARLSGTAGAATRSALYTVSTVQTSRRYGRAYFEPRLASLPPSSSLRSRAGAEQPRTASMWRAPVTSAAARALVISLSCTSVTASMNVSSARQAPRASPCATSRSACSMGLARSLPCLVPFTAPSSSCRRVTGLGGGGSAGGSATVTVKVADTDDGVSSVSVAVQVTVVVPSGNTEPGAWSQATVAVASSSVAVGGV